MAKKLFILSILIILPIFAQADDMCKTIATVAGITMESRQKGVPMDKLLDIYKSIKDSNPQLYKAFKTLAIVAYEMPRYHTESMQKRMIEDYYNNAYLQCIKKD